jgi:hypothetical protein
VAGLFHAIVDDGDRCRNCSIRKAVAMKRCRTCYRYRWANGEDRPTRLFGRAPDT